MSEAQLYTVATILIVLVIGSFVMIAVTKNMSQKSAEAACGACSERTPSSKVEGFAHGRDFYIYNYYKVPVDVKIVPPGGDREHLIVSQVPPGGRLGVRWGQISSVLQKGAVVRVYTRKVGSIHETIIGKSELRVPEGTTIKALHVGMSSGHEDLSMAGESTKSTLGTALPRVRIVNASPRCLMLTAGSDSIKILPHSSHLYYGENNMGIHLGTILRDQDGFLQDYVINRPMTDIHLGLISDVQTSLYSGSKFGGDFDDTVEVQDLHSMGGPHNGALRDRAYIP